MIYFMNGSNLQLIASTSVTAPNVWKGTDSVTWSNFVEYTDPEYYAPMTITYGSSPTPSSGGVTMPPPPAWVQI